MSSSRDTTPTKSRSLLTSVTQEISPSDIRKIFTKKGYTVDFSKTNFNYHDLNKANNVLIQTMCECLSDPELMRGKVQFHFDLCRFSDSSDAEKIIQVLSTHSEWFNLNFNWNNLGSQGVV